MDILFGVVGGLGLFLFGMRSMSEGLQKAAGDRLRRLLEVLTTNRVSGVFMGAVVTALIQSSSTTTVMVVGFVNARLMTLQQAVGVIMGANIGTTLTAQLIAFQLDRYVLPAIGIGVAMLMFARSEKTRHVGQIVLGFGVLFLGLDIMKDSLKPLRELDAFREALISFGQNPVMGVVVGTAITAIIQSSSAAIGLLQSLAAEGLISIQAALPILFGDNVGTTITALLSAIGASIAARRAAAVHVVFNLVGVVLFLIALPLVTPLVVATSTDVVRQIANAHTIFNLGNTIIQLPLAGLIVWIVLRLVPDRKRGEAPAEQQVQHLDQRLLETPSAALNVVKDEVMDMATQARSVVTESLDLLLSGQDGDYDRIFETESEVNRLNRSISGYLAQLGRRTLSNEQRSLVHTMHNLVADIERVADHGENIAELGQFSRKNNVSYSDQAIGELRAMADRALEAFDLAIKAWSEDDHETAQRVFEIEQSVDGLEKEVRSSHIDRLNRGDCEPTAGVVFLDLASNLERIADHGANIAALVAKN